MPTREIAEHVLICARKLYEETDLQSEIIAQLMGMSASGLHKRAARLGWRARQRAYRGKGAALEAGFAGLQARIARHVEQRMTDVERNLSKPGPREARLADSERAARTLASLARTLNELKRLEAGGTEAGPKAGDDDIDVEEFERDIARHLDELRSEAGDPEKT